MDQIQSIPPRCRPVRRAPAPGAKQRPKYCNHCYYCYYKSMGLLTLNSPLNLSEPSHLPLELFCTVLPAQEGCSAQHKIDKHSPALCPSIFLTD